MSRLFLAIPVTTARPEIAELVFILNWSRVTHDPGPCNSVFKKENGGLLLDYGTTGGNCSPSKRVPRGLPGRDVTGFFSIRGASAGLS